MTENLRIKVIDQNHYDELIAHRTELILIPTPDGSPSTNGRVVFHTVWNHYRYGKKFAESIGPRIEHDFDTVMGRTFDVIVDHDDLGNPIPFHMPTMLMIGGIKAAFDVLACEYLEALEPPVLPPQPQPETQE